MSDRRIDKLVLRIPGTSRDGERLARRVAAALAAAPGLGSGESPGVRVRLSDDPAAGDDALAERIVAEILRSLPAGGR